MGEAEHSHYVAQLKAEFDSCDSSASGFLDRDQLVALCRKLQLEAELPRLIHLLLGECASSRVNFQDFKDGFVSLLSRSLDVSPSEDNSCPLEPVVPDEVKPKFVKGTKRYGRRSRPDIKSVGTLSQDSEDSAPSTTETTDYLQAGVRRAKLRRSTSLESVESLKSDEETGSQKITEPNFIHKAFQQQEGEEHDSVGGANVMTDLSDRPCLHEQLNNQDLNPVLRNMDPDLDSRLTVGDLRNLLRGSVPLSCSTPAKAADLKRAPLRDELLSEEHSLRSTSPSLLTATVGQRVLSRLDDGSGCTSPENVIALWTEEGIRNSRDILQTLDFPLEERLSLTDLTLALDNELLVSGNGIHQAALISYKNEIQHLQLLAEQACRQRDKVRADLDAADHRNLKLVREVDDRHANMETLNQSRLRDLEQDFRDRLSALRCESEQEIEVLQQQAEEECRALQEELHLLQTQEEELRVELNTTTQENSRLEDELFVVKLKLKEAEKMVNKLQCDLDRVLQDKFEGLDRAGAALSHEERFSEIIKQYELQCRELLDRNDELSSELELLKSQRSDRESRRSAGDTRTTAALTWTEQTVSAESDCDDLDVKQPPAAKKKLQPVDKTGLSSLDNISGPVVSIQTEMALEQLKQKHEQELQELRIQLETQVNFYERNLELMRQNMEVERKDISQAFKLEISELEEHKAQAEQQVQQLKDSLEKLQMQKGGGGIGGGGAGWTSEQERRTRMQRERSDMEQNFAREIGNLVERLRAEKDQLEAELRLKMDQEVMLVRTQLEELRAENSALQERVKVLQQDVQNLEDDVAKKKRKVEELEGEHERSREEEERLHRENCRYREEVLELSSRNLQLSNDNAELSARLRGDEESLRMLQQRLATVSEKTEEGEALVRRLQTTATQQEREKVQQQVAWTQERHLLEDELKVCKQKLGHLSDLEAELSATTLKLQWMDEDKKKLLRETENHKQELEALQHSIVSLQSEAELFRSRLQAANKEKLGHIQEVTELQRKLEETHNKVERLELSVQRLRQEKEEQCRVMAVQEQQASVTLREETQRLSIQNQELLHQLASLQAKQQEAQNLNHEQQNLKTRLSELETERTKANEQAVRADAALSLVRAQHTRQLQERASSGSGNREREEQLETWLKEEQRRSQQLEETLKHQTGLISIKQEQYEKVSSSLQQRTEDLELKLKAVQTVLQENVQQLKEQLAKNAKSNAQLKDVYVENSQLIKALQITEQRQKHAEKKNILLEEKIGALHRLLRQIVPAALAT